MKRIASIATGLLILFCHAAYAQTPLCNGALLRPQYDFKQEIQKLDNAAFEIATRWTQDPEWTSLAYAERLKRREAAIDKVYEDVRQRRTAAYQAATCIVSDRKKCASTAGKKHKCPRSIDAPLDTLYVQGSLKQFDNDYDPGEHPAISPDRKVVDYTVKKTGSGSNTGGFDALVQFAPAVVAKWVDSEVSRAQDYLSPLLRTQLQTSTGAGQGGTDTAPANDCVSALERLARLRAGGIISESEFQIAKAGLKQCFGTSAT